MVKKDLNGNEWDTILLKRWRNCIIAKASEISTKNMGEPYNISTARQPSAFRYTPYDDGVLPGQDPYHESDKLGMAFSVKKVRKQPPSLEYFKDKF